MRLLLLGAIRFYQRHLSPRKGFCCAYRHHTGRASCSALGFRVVRRFGAWAGLGLLRRRLHLCGVAYRRYNPPRFRPFVSQRGECDLPCDAGCDLPSGKAIGSRVCDCLSYADCGSCDWPDRKRKQQADERQVYIPPRSGRER